MFTLHVVFSIGIFVNSICFCFGMGAHFCRCFESCGVEQEATIEDNDIDGYMYFILNFEALFYD